MASGGLQQQDYSQTYQPTAPSIPSYSTTSFPTNPAFSNYSTTVTTPSYSTGTTLTYTAPTTTLTYTIPTTDGSSTSYSTSSSMPSQISTITTSVMSVDEKKAILDQKFANLIKMFELPTQTASQLQILANTKIVMLCDDSSSMGSPIAEEGTDPFALKTSTRWGELKKSLRLLALTS